MGDDGGPLVLDEGDEGNEGRRLFGLEREDQQRVVLLLMGLARSEEGCAEEGGNGRWMRGLWRRDGEEDRRG